MAPGCNAYNLPTLDKSLILKKTQGKISSYDYFAPLNFPLVFLGKKKKKKKTNNIPVPTMLFADVIFRN